MQQGAISEGWTCGAEAEAGRWRHDNGHTQATGTTGRILSGHVRSATSGGHPFYQRLNELLEEAGLDAFVEKRCRRFYAPTMGRPSLTPEVYFRLLLLGYSEGLDSEREIGVRSYISEPQAAETQVASGQN